MTNDTLAADLDSFGAAYTAMYNLGIDGEIIFSFVTDFAKRFEEPKPEPKISYQIFMRYSGREWGAGNRKPEFLTYGEAKKYLLDFYAPFTGDHQLALSDHIFAPNWWGKTYEIRKVTESTNQD